MSGGALRPMLDAPARTAPTEAIPMDTNFAAQLAAEHRDALLAEAREWRLARQVRRTRGVRVTWGVLRRLVLLQRAHRRMRARAI
jgi:hypothetical protein